MRRVFTLWDGSFTSPAPPAEPGDAFEHSQPFTITGAGFGTNSGVQSTLGFGSDAILALPLGSAVPGYTDPISGLVWSLDPVVQTADDTGFAVSEDIGFRTARAVMRTPNNGSDGNTKPEQAWIELDAGPIPDNTRILVSWWSKNTATLRPGSSPPGQLKQFRLGTRSRLNGSNANSFYLSHNTNGAGVLVYKIDESTDPMQSSASGGLQCPRWDDDKNTRMDLYIRSGTRDTANGYIGGRIHKPADGVPIGAALRTFRNSSNTRNTAAFQFLTAADPTPWRYLKWQNYYGNGLHTARTHLWGVYVQVGSWRHVELGDAPTYATCTRSEICRWTSWSDTSVTFRARFGQLGSGPKWVYLFDDNGAVINPTGVELTSTSLTL
jgi:hypothetical protein